ncbi:energy transducer TonB family protein [Roseateles cellulosilyticus]|uniref:Energy transducer TonB n=1 Tax=Pelomonas cellulosilytica TaxID=2906762 RepID=A0ABS8XRM2_9BURK|nr:energy transducer TonB [Pelomonas sp. P8]MCE4555371.1 energy transducer TonB [Pelomonas sp. P8]
MDQFALRVDARDKTGKAVSYLLNYKVAVVEGITNEQLPSACERWMKQSRKSAVDKVGAVTDVKLLIPSGTSALDNALVAAAKTCRFQPGTRGGVPAALTTSWVEVWERTPSAPQMTRVLPPPTSAPPQPASSSEANKL